MLITIDEIDGRICLHACGHRPMARPGWLLGHFPTTTTTCISNCEVDVRITTWLISGAALAATFSAALAVDLSGDPYGLWKPLRGAVYKFHSGIVADATPPTSSERRLTVLVDGKTAKEIFDSIGPDYPETCTVSC